MSELNTWLQTKTLQRLQRAWSLSMSLPNKLDPFSLNEKSGMVESSNSRIDDRKAKKNSMGHYSKDAFQ